MNAATGLQVSCQRERERGKNRFIALRALVDKIERNMLGDDNPSEEEIAAEKRRKQKARRKRRAKAARAAAGEQSGSEEESAENDDDDGHVDDFAHAHL